MCVAERSLFTKWSLTFLWLSAQVTRGVTLDCSVFIYLGGAYGTHTGTFESPGFPSSVYPNNDRCTWIIKVPLDHLVKLYFNEFDVESCSFKHENCSCDAVEVYDGELLINKRLAKLCGNEVPAPILSSGEFMRIDLVSDEDTGKKGFSARFHSVSPDGSTPPSFDSNDGKPLKTNEPTDNGDSAGNSDVMIAIVCSLVGIVIISSVILFFYRRKNKRNAARTNEVTRRDVSEMVPPASQRQHAGQRYNVPVEPPPPYHAAVTAPSPPPYL